MRYSVVVEKAIGEHSEVIERDGIVPTRHDKSGARDTFFEKILFVTILQHIPLGAVDGRSDVITVLRLACANALQRVVAVFGDFYGVVRHMKDFVLIDGSRMIRPIIVAHHIPRTRGRHIGIIIIMVKVGKVQRMSHLVPEHMGREILRSTFKLKIERVGLDSIDYNRMVDGVVREILHVGPKYGRPCTCTSLNDKTHIVDKTVAVTIKDNVIVDQMKRIHITERTGQQLGFSPTDAYHHLLILLIANRIRRAIRLEIATRFRVLIRDDVTILYVVGIDRAVMDMVVCHRLIEIINAEVSRSLSVEHGVNVVK